MIYRLRLVATAWSICIKCISHSRAKWSMYHVLIMEIHKYVLRVLRYELSKSYQKNRSIPLRRSGIVTPDKPFMPSILGDVIELGTLSG
jgi:hypothetical protein